MLNNNTLKNKIMAATTKFRNAYYVTHREEPRTAAYAFGGKPTESIGAFAEYNLRGRHCRRSLGGLCTPCFYSKFPDIIGISDYTQFLIEQIDKLMDNFEETIICKKCGEIYYDKESLNYKANDPLALCLTPVGSFFDNNELSVTARVHMLKQLVQKSKELSRDVILYVETHVLDFISWNKNRTDLELNLMRQLHLRVVFGFESRDEFVRNVLYCKAVNIDDFEFAVSLAKQHGFVSYAFVFAGLYPMTHSEIISDVRETFEYLKLQDVVPVLMFANVQEYTIGDMLVKNDYAKLVNPLTVLEVIKIMLDTFGRINMCGCDAWLIADPVGGPPNPVRHIFADSEIQCCSEKIYRLILKLRANHEYPSFDNEYREIIDCQHHKAIFASLSKAPSELLIERTEKMIEFIEENADCYLQTLRRDEITHIKAMLLCEGVYANNTATEAMRALGIADGFIHSPNLLLDEFTVNACMMEHFLKEPHCSITYLDGKFYLHYRSPESIIPEFIGSIDFIRTPKWGNKIVAGHLVSDYLRPHSKHCISVWPNQKCALGERKCMFCTLSGITALEPEVVADMIDVALESDQTYEVHISGGVYVSFEKNEDYYSQISYIIHNRHPTTRISLETTPPLSIDGLQKYKDSGISSLIMNLEIANESARNELCNGKSEISLKRYFEAYEEGVGIFGKWNIGAVLLWGIKAVTKEQLLNCVQKMCSMGIYPVIMPFQPLVGSALQKAAPTDAESFWEISKEVGRIVTESSRKETVCKFGCINCGACSIENYFVKENQL